MRFSSIASATLVSAMLSGCAPEEAIDPTASEGDEVAAGAAYRYACTSTQNGLFGPSVMLTLSARATKATVSIRYDDGRAATFRGVYDANYHPRTNTDYARYGDFDLTDHEVIVQNTLRTGATSGAVKIQGRGDSYGGSFYYRCRRTTDPTPSEPRAYEPSAFAMQFVGPWNPDWSQIDSNGAPSHLRDVQLRRDGRYALLVEESGTRHPETGTWSAGSATGLPVTLRFRSGAFSWTGVIRTLGGPIEWTRGAQHLSLVPGWTTNAAAVCRSSGGAWRAAGADPATGLQCACPGGRFFVPSIAGCTD